MKKIIKCTPTAVRKGDKIKETNERIFKEWLPNSNDYEIAAGFINMTDRCHIYMV